MRDPKVGNLIYFPGTSNISVMVARIVKIDKDEEGRKRAYIINILPKIEKKIRIGDEGDWIGEESILWSMSFIVGKDVEEHGLIGLAFNGLLQDD